jgi:hypothetical protein
MRSNFRYAPGRAFGTPEFAEVRTPIDPRGAFVDLPPKITWADTEISESFVNSQDGHGHPAQVNVQNRIVETDDGLLAYFWSAKPFCEPKWALQVPLL